MSAAITGTFATRRDAEMAVERLVQEFGVERTDIFIAPEGDAIIVSVDVNDDETSGKITDAFEEFGGTAEGEG